MEKRCGNNFSGGRGGFEILFYFTVEDLPKKFGISLAFTNASIMLVPIEIDFNIWTRLMQWLLGHLKGLDYQKVGFIPECDKVVAL